MTAPGASPDSPGGPFDVTVAPAPVADVLASAAAGPDLTVAATYPTVLASSLLGEALALVAVAERIEQALENLSNAAVVGLVRGLVTHPQDWAKAFGVALVRELWSTISSPFTVLLGVLAWLAETTACVALPATIGWAELQGPEILRAELADSTRDICRDYDAFRATLRTVSDAADEVEGALRKLLAHPVDAVTAAAPAIVVALEAVAEALGDDRVADAVGNEFADPEKGGAFVGTVVANVVLLVVPSRLAALLLRGADTSLATRKAAAAAKLAEITGDAATDEVEFNKPTVRLMEAVRAALARSGQRMGYPATVAKLEAVNSVAKDLDLTSAALAAARDEIVSMLRSLRGTVGPYRDLRKVLSAFNAHAGAVLLLSADEQEIKAAADLVTLNPVFQETMLDGAHIVDARFHSLFSPTAREVLGWATADDMDAVLATASEHRRSWPQYLNGEWFPDLSEAPSGPPDLDEYQTITRYFADRIVQVDEAGRPVGSVPLDVLTDAATIRIGPGTKASEILEKHLQIWKQDRFSGPGRIASKGVIPRLEELIAALRTKSL